MEEQKAIILFNRIASIYLYFMGRAREGDPVAVYHFLQGQPFYTKHVPEIMSGLRELFGAGVSLSSKRIVTYIGHDCRLYRGEEPGPGSTSDHLYTVWTDVQIIAEWGGV